jgi:cell envelope opacity-associated protein A
MPTLTEQLDAYVKQLTPMEKKVLQIAKEHLETSFSLENSIGFIKWKEAQVQVQVQAQAQVQAQTQVQVQVQAQAQTL